MNKNYYKSFIAAAVLTSLQQTALADTIGPIVATQDTWTNEAKPSDNYASSVTFRIDTAKMRGFLQFNVDGIPAGHEVVSATITLTADSNKNGDIIPDTYLASISGVTWDETTLSADNDTDLINAVGPTVASVTDIQVGVPTNFDVTSAITDNGSFTFMVNIADKGSRATKYHTSSAADASFQPQLTIITQAKDTGGTGDTNPPVFAASIPAIELNATGTLTDISDALLAANITATDDTDGEVIATLVGTSELTSGANTIPLQAMDRAGNSASQDIQVNITPMLDVTAPTEAPAGANTSVSVKLSGPAVSYPATIDFNVSGAVSSADSGTLTFTADDHSLAQTIDLALAAGAVAGQFAEVTFSNPTNVQSYDGDVAIAALVGNVAPAVSIDISQGNNVVTKIDADNASAIHYIDGTLGEITVSVNIDDFNQDDEHDTNWAGSSDDLMAASNTFSFMPEHFYGLQTLNLAVNETNTSPALNAQLQAKINIINAPLPDLTDVDTDQDGVADNVEGYKDSDRDGILDYLDNSNDVSQLPLMADQSMLQTTDGLTLSLGSISKSALGINAHSGNITLAQLKSGVPVGSADTADIGFFPLEGVNIINFNLAGMEPGTAATLVYPLPPEVTLNDKTEYRKYTPENGWMRFTDNGDNSIKSAPRAENQTCPAPNEVAYTDGLTSGNSCIQLTIVDGGIYDADGEINGAVEDPGLLAEANAAPIWNQSNINLAAVNTNENVATSISENLALRASDADGDNLTISKSSGPDWFSLDEAGLLTANLSGVVSGDYSASFIVTDSKQQTAEAQVHLTVNLNQAPILAAIELPNAGRNEAYSASIADLISDPESDTYTVTKASGPYWLKVSEQGQLSGTPRNIDIGENQFSVTLTDSAGANSTHQLSLTVEDTDTRDEKAGALSASLFSVLSLLWFGRRRKLT